VFPDHDIAFTGDALYKDDRTAEVGDRLKHHITHTHTHTHTRSTFNEHHYSDNIIYFQLHVVHHGRPKDSPDSAEITGPSRRSCDIRTWDVVYVYTSASIQFMLTYV
jgi:hypothetical protein